MGCCAVKNGVVYSKTVEVTKKRIDLNKALMLERATTEGTENVKEETEEEDAQFQDYIVKLKQAYGITSYNSVWFNRGEEIYMGRNYLLETDRYDISCEITHIDPKKINNVKFALISPQIQESNYEGLLKNLIFVYCWEKREETAEKVVPVIMQIEKSSADADNGIFNFTANINCIVKMNLTLTSKKL